MTEHEDLIAEARFARGAYSLDSDTVALLDRLADALEKVTAERDAEVVSLVRASAFTSEAIGQGLTYTAEILARLGVSEMRDRVEKTEAERDELSSLREQMSLRLRYVEGKREQAEAERDALDAVVEQISRVVENFENGDEDFDAEDTRKINRSLRGYLNAAPSVELDRVKAEARESVVTPEAREHWEWTQKGRQAHGDRGCVCALCGVMERVYRKGESND